MAAFLARRTLTGALTLLAVSVLTFVVFSLLPSADPALARAGPNPTPELLQTIRAQLGLDEPWPVQLGLYLEGLVTRLDLGFSFDNDASVLALVLDRLPATLSLTAGAAVLWLLVAVPVGALSALRPRGAFDRVTGVLSLLALSAPVYWLGLVALYLFAQDIGRFELLPGQDSYVPLTEDPLAWAGSLVLPWCVLAAGFAAVYARLLRGGMVEALSEPHVRTARAKGLSERAVAGRHALPSAGAPLVTLLGLDLGLLLGGAVLTETVFNVPGVGRLAVDAIGRGDLPVIQGTVLFAAFAIVVANLLVDLAYAALDPRVRADR
jgi:peptide/nickel transport system permease protein